MIDRAEAWTHAASRSKGWKALWSYDFLPNKMLKQFLVVFWNIKVSDNERHVNAEDFLGLTMELIEGHPNQCFPNGWVRSPGPFPGKPIFVLNYIYLLCYIK